LLHPLNRQQGGWLLLTSSVVSPESSAALPPLSTVLTLDQGQQQVDVTNELGYGTGLMGRANSSHEVEKQFECQKWQPPWVDLLRAGQASMHVWPGDFED